MDRIQELIDELDAQLVTAARLASNRAEYLRLTQISSTVTRLRAETAIVGLQLAPTG